MPIYMDVHQSLGDATAADIKAAHQRDLSLQDKYGVQWLTYWFNNPDGRAFCLVEAPSQETATACHKESHGLIPHKMIEVDRPSVAQFMGPWERDAPATPRLDGPESAPDTGVRAILFTDLESSTDVSTRLGDVTALELVRRHNAVVRAALAAFSGREVKHTGDGILASFTLVSRAIEAAIEMQRQFAGPAPAARIATRVRIGIAAGEPVTESDDLFGAAVNLAARICAHAEPGQILVSGSVKELAIGKGFRFEDQGVASFKGFAEPIALFRVEVPVA